MSRDRLACIASTATAILLGLGATAWSAPITITSHHKAPLGEYLTDGNGRALYVFTADKNGKSACDAACAKAWPPVTTDGVVNFGDGAKAGEIDTIARGKQRQLTYGGRPLYYFAHDTAPGSTAGEASKHFGGSWYVVSPDGQPVLPDGQKLGS